MKVLCSRPPLILLLGIHRTGPFGSESSGRRRMPEAIPKSSNQEAASVTLQSNRVNVNLASDRTKFRAGTRLNPHSCILDFRVSYVAPSH